MGTNQSWDFAYQISDILSQQEVDTLVEWLCSNCRENFIVTKKTAQIVAGGSTEPWLTYQLSLQTEPEYFEHYYEIKLYESDRLAFELAWLTQQSQA